MLYTKLKFAPFLLTFELFSFLEISFSLMAGVPLNLCFYSKHTHTHLCSDMVVSMFDVCVLQIMSGGVDRDVSSQHDHSQESSGSAVDTVSNNTRPVVARTVAKNLDFNSACAADTDAACVAEVSSVKAPPETSAGAANPPSADRVMVCPSDASIQRPSQCAVGSALQSERRAGEFSWWGLIELMLQHLSPTLTNQLLNEVAARKPLNEKLVQQLHSVLVQLTATYTEQRYTSFNLF